MEKVYSNMYFENKLTLPWQKFDKKTKQQICEAQHLKLKIEQHQH